MTKLETIVDVDAMEYEIDNGYINRRFHNEFPELAIVGYSDACQFDDHWNETTIALRGLIYNTQTMEVLARPFHKFFNYGDETHMPPISLYTPIMGAYPKFDGSLGIGYIRPDGQFSIATRGSFHSEQADHANARLQYMSVEYFSKMIRDGSTPLFEIIYPENRIVVDYGSADEMVFLGSVGIEYGNYSTNGAFTENNKANGRQYVCDIVEQPELDNKEGFVIWFDAYTAIKFKFETYKALHKIISGLTEKEVWRQLRAGTYTEWAEKIPDEFYDWANGVAEGLTDRFSLCANTVDDYFFKLFELGYTDRKAQALWIQQNVPAEIRGMVFSALDEKDYSDAIWRKLEPKLIPWISVP
jgi:RNA ligase